MDPALQVELEALSRQKAMNEATERGDSAVQQFYSGAAVFVTGGSGFLGKQLIEKLFRSCDIKVLYMLIRPKKGKTVKERLAEVLRDPVFKNLHEKQPGFVAKIVAIGGDVAATGIGISQTDRETLIQQVNVIFHVAATITFDEPLRSATFTNIRGTRDIITLARQCQKLRSFIYMSTAYSHATFSRRNSEVLEQFYPSPVPPDLMIRLAETVEDQMLNQMKDGLIQGWPNNYSFTKAIAEEAVRVYGAGLPIIVLRPSIVICCNREPLPGCIDTGSVYGPSGMMLGCAMGVIHTMLSRQDIKIDLVPSDYVINAAIIAAFKGDKTVYNISSSCRNPITWGRLATISQDIVGKKFISPKAMWYCFVIQTPNKWLFVLLSFILHKLKACSIDGVCMVLGKKQRARKIYATIEKMSSIFAYYTTNNWIFNDNNTVELFKSLSATDRVIYHCDVTDVEWTEQIVLWCVGLRKYIIKDGLTNTEWGMRKQLYYRTATYVISGLFIYVALLFLRYLFY